MDNLQPIDDRSYLPKLLKMLETIEREESVAISRAAEAAYRSIKAGGLLHVFSTGHSHMIVEEMFYRTGGLIPVNPILENDLMLHEGAITSTLLERQPGKAAEVLGKAGISKGDTVIISSNSGINTVPIEAAIFAKEKGATIICVTSVETSKVLQSRYKDGKKLYEVGDIVIDNHAPLGDGLLEVPANHQPTGGASTFGSLFIAQRIVLKIENRFLAEGKLPPIFQSANIPGGDEFNNRAIEPYRGRIKALH